MIRGWRPTGGRVGATLVVWGTAIAIAGTLGACGRYGPPQRRPPGAPAETVGGVPVAEPVGAGEPGAAGDAAGAGGVDEPSDEEEKKQ